MTRRRRLRLTREGLYFLLVLLSVLVGATVRQLNLLILLGAVLTGPFVFSLFAGRLALGRFRVERQLPKVLRADQRLAVDVPLTNLRRWLRIWSIVVEDRLTRADSAELEASRVGVFFPAVAGGETQRAVYHGYLPQRGRYLFGPLRVSTTFPLGLVRHSILVDDQQTLLVHPKLGKLTHDWTKVARQAVAGGQAVQRRGAMQAEFYGLRDWRPGDNRRWIHWRSSARRGTLVVRQFEEHRSRDLALLVDLWQPPDPSDAQQDVTERTVSFVATLIAEGCRQPGRRLFLSLAAVTSLERSGPASPLFFQQQMDELALVAPHHDAALPTSLPRALAQLPQSIPTLLVSTRPIDWQTLQAAAEERNINLAGRQIQSVDTSGADLSRYYQD
ncbi:MAG: DUF58 domain-containing protein [Pirellulales bacterium]